MIELPKGMNFWLETAAGIVVPHSYHAGGTYAMAKTIELAGSTFEAYKLKHSAKKPPAAASPPNVQTAAASPPNVQTAPASAPNVQTAAASDPFHGLRVHELIRESIQGNRIPDIATDKRIEQADTAIGVMEHGYRHGRKNRKNSQDIQKADYVADIRRSWVALKQRRQQWLNLTIEQRAEASIQEAEAAFAAADAANAAARHMLYKVTRSIAADAQAAASTQP